MDLTLSELQAMFKELPQTQTSCNDIDKVILADSPQEFMDCIVDMRLENPNKEFMVRMPPIETKKNMIGARIQMK